MQKLSLKIKLYAATLSTIPVLACILVFSSFNAISSLSQHSSDFSEKSLTLAALNQVQTQSSLLGEQVNSYIGRMLKVPSLVAQILATNAHNPEGLSRDEVSSLVKDSLLATPELSSSYAHFESYGYDNLDALLTTSNQLYDTEIGSLEVYWVREGSELTLEEVDPEEKTDASLTPEGLREAEWYLCSKETLKPCIMEPYLYELNDQQLPMSGLVYPIIKNQQFLGIAGVDINLPVFQQLIEEVSQSLYQGQAKVSLLSHQGLVVASSHHTNHLMKPFKNALPNGEELAKLHLQPNKLLVKDQLAYVATSLPIEDTNSVWSLLIELPLNLVLEDLNQLLAGLEEKQTSLLSQQLVTAVVIMLISLGLITLLINSILRPINRLNSQIQQLASGEGDLTQAIEINTHAELISLGKSFNTFIGQLRNLINEVKATSQQVRQESNASLNLNLETLNSTQAQQNEIDQVATATQEMSATANEVANIASQVATNTEKIHHQVSLAQDQLNLASQQVEELSQKMQLANTSISLVVERSNEINSILEVIRGIAEQTNLLALNAAIEAARAGEQGRGFAVVADEVRSLAARTQDSTAEIDQMTLSLQDEVAKAVASIEASNTSTQLSSQATLEANSSLNLVVTAIEGIANNISQVATAAEEQSSVSDELASSLTSVSGSASNLAELASNAAQNSQQVAKQLDTMDQHINRLKT